MNKEKASRKIGEILSTIDKPQIREAAKVIEEAMDAVSRYTSIIDPVNAGELTTRIRSMFAAGIGLEDLLQRVQFPYSASEQKLAQLRAGLRAYSAEAAEVRYLAND